MQPKNSTSIFMLEKKTLLKSTAVLFSAGLLFMSIFTGCKKQADVTPAKATTAVAKQETDYVNTPYGKVLASKVHLVEQGAQITIADGHIKKINSATGETLADYGPAAATTSTNNTGSKFSALNFAANSSAGSLGNGYYVEGPLPKGKIIQSFSTSWTVPKNPVAGADSTLFLWNGADNDNGGNAFMQPVLGWNDGHGHLWFVQNWGFTNGNYFHSDIIKVPSGAIVTGVMTLISGYPGAYTYSIAFTGYPSITFTQTYPDPANETIECWEAYANSYIYFPANKDIAMQSMNLQYVGAGSTNQPITWEQTSDGALVTPSGKNTVIENNGTNNSIVDFYFK